MSEPVAEPAGLELSDSRRTFVVEWADGARTSVPYRELRLLCPCAVCVDELTGERVLDPDSVPEDVGIETTDEVGLYGIRIHWTDGHKTGIFTWDRLRRLSP